MHGVGGVEYPQERVLQAGEARILRVLRGGRGADGHGGGAELRVCIEDGLLDGRGQRFLLDAGAQGSGDLSHGIEIIGIQPLDQRAHRRALLQREEELLEGMGRHDEAGRHVDAGVGQLAQTCALAAHGGPVCDAEVSEPADRGFSTQSSILDLFPFAPSEVEGRARAERGLLRLRSAQGFDFAQPERTI